jgi:hypothetical protein
MAETSAGQRNLQSQSPRFCKEDIIRRESHGIGRKKMKIKRFLDWGNIMRRKRTGRRLVLCVKNDDCDDLEKRKVYRVIADEKAEKDGCVRVVDESGEDYLYPASYFVRVQLPQAAKQAIAATG